MSGDDELGRHHFLAWSRQGIAATLTNPDYGSPLPIRGALEVALNVVAQNPASSTPIAPVAVQTFGPGDVLGIDPRHVVRTEPRDSTTNFEPNYLAGIEFDAPDFPWLFTPAAPAGDRLRPWITLIVLAASEFAPVAGVVHPLPAIDVTSLAAVQPLDDAWNWAHTQVSGDAGLAATASSSPAGVLSRLLCPRRLDPETAYSAFVVPTFEIGRLAGLGLDTSGVASADIAWTATTGTPLRLPVYYQFRFHTSDQGDFESLVRRLTPRVLGASIGQRPMEVDAAMPDIPSAGAPLGLDGALKSIATTESEWDDPPKTQFQTAVQGLVNRTLPLVDDPSSPDPQVVPPMYGRWPAGLLSVALGSTGWLDELNLDPRNRVAGGMGTQVVQGEQTALMASAWQQVAGIDAANAALRAAQLSRATLTMVHANLALATDASVLTMTAPLHARMLASPITVRALIESSRVPSRLLSPAARRITHPSGIVRRRQSAMAPAGAVPITVGSLLRRINANTVTIVPPPAPPGGLVAIEDIDAAIAPPWAKWFPITLSARTPFGVFRVIVEAEGSEGAGDGSGRGTGPGGPGAGSGSVAGPVSVTAITPQTVASVPARPAFSVTVPPTTPGSAGDGAGAAGGGAGFGGAGAAGGGAGFGGAGAAGGGAGFDGAGAAGNPGASAAGSASAPGTASAAIPSDSAEAALFRRALSPLAAAWNAAAPDPVLAPALDIATLSQSILARIDPVSTVPNRVLSLVSFAGLANWHPADPIREIMAAPSFPQPMYEPLRDLSEQYVLPGADQIPPDSVGLLETNHAFIESYMVGLSHEMARQLLFAGYPTDCMGTYFRQFWDVSKYVPTASDPSDPAVLAEQLKDIPPIVTWPLSAGLGQHENRTGVVADNVVLIIRGELLRRYPDAIIYAAKATISDGARVIDPTDERFPIFAGSLPGDMNFLGFNLSAADAKGGTATAPDGFFFVFQQHPTGPRFGLEPSAAGTVTAWADLAWTNFGGPQPVNPNPAAPPALVAPWTERRLMSSTFQSVLATRPLPGFLSAGLHPAAVAVTGDDAANQWGTDAAQTAYITARLPFRVAIHADLMVPSS